MMNRKDYYKNKYKRNNVMTKEKPLVLLLTLSILFNALFHDSLNFTIEMTFPQNVYAHSFISNNYAKFLSSIDGFQTESKLIYDNLIMGNSSLAEKHAAEAVSIFYWDLMSESDERDKKVSDEIKTAIENLQNISLSVSKIPSGSSQDFNKQEQIKRASQLLRVIDTNSNVMINITESERQREDSNPLNQFVAFLANIFNAQKDSSNLTINPMRFVEVVDNILRNYGDAYDVKFDMTDMSTMANMANMANMSDTTSMIMNNESAKNNQKRIGSIENAANYQNAMGLTEKLLEIFKTELKPIMSTDEKAMLSSNLENGILQLFNAIKEKASPRDIMMIVHTQIHPNLMKAFNLQLISGD